MKRENLLKAICLITKTNMINAGQCYYISDNAGLFDVWSGGGSLLEIELDKDVVLPIKCIWHAEIETGKSEYGYSVDSVYGLVGSAWYGTVTKTHYMKPEQIEKIEKEMVVA